MNMEETIAAQKQRLKKLENQRDLDMIAAKLQAYSEAVSGEVCNENKAAHSKVTSPPVPCKEIKGEQTCHNNNKDQINNTQYSEASLVQARHDTMVLTRVPAPEPSVFSGDPLKFLEWSTSFKASLNGDAQIQQTDCFTCRNTSVVRHDQQWKEPSTEKMMKPMNKHGKH